MSVPIAFIDDKTTVAELRGRTLVAVIVPLWKAIRAEIMEAAKLCLATTAQQFECKVEDLIIEVS